MPVGLSGFNFAEFSERLNGIYHACCNDHSVSLSAGDIPPDYQRYINALIKQLWDAKQVPETDPNLIRAYGTKLQEALTEGYGGNLADFAWDSPDYRTLVALQNNVWQFSAAKTHEHLTAMNAALIGPDGKIRSYDEFKREAQNITNEQLNWLRTEYDTAIGSAQMAAKWQTIQEQKKTFPLLEFDAVIDDRTSTICRPLNKVVRPVDDPFWDKYYPPNHFNCRSTVRQLRTGTVTPVDEIQYPEKVPDMFKFNVGKKAIAFPDGLSYYDNVPPHLINNATLYMPQDEQYIIKYQAPDGTQLQVNRKTAIENAPDYQNLMTVGRVLADHGIVVDILPVIHASEETLRNELLPAAKTGKNPDVIINGEYGEVKTPTDPVTYSKLQKLIANAASQADMVVILLDAKFTEAEMKGAAENRFKVFPELKEISFVTPDGEYIQFINDKRQQK